MEGSYTIVFHFGEEKKKKNGGGIPPLRLAFSPNLCHVSLPSLSTTIFPQMGCEDGPVVKLVSSQRGHRERIM